MEAIPQDVWDAADVAHFAATKAERTREEVNIIARAILAERKRCADVVRNEMPKRPREEYDHGKERACENILDGIEVGA